MWSPEVFIVRRSDHSYPLHYQSLATNNTGMRKCLFPIVFFCFNFCQTLWAQSSSEQTSNDSKIHCQTEDGAAYYPGGARAWVKHLRKHLTPLKAPCESGRVRVRFKVLKSGIIDSVQIIRGICESADQNALEVINKSAPWYPECRNGEAADSYVTLQIFLHYK